MPIRGLTDQRVSFPRIGVLRKGGEKPDEKRPGKDLTYFRFDSDDAEAVAAFEAAYGKEPRVIRCYLPYSDVDSNFQTFMEEWVGGGLVRRCDRENILIERTAKGTYDKNPHPCKGEGQCKCKQVGRLMIVIPELKRLAHVMALTTSIHDIMELHANLSAALEFRGDLRGIPFMLSRKPREISTPKPDGGRARYEKWLLSIEPAPAWVKSQIEQMPSFVEPAQLPAPDDEDEQITVKAPPVTHTSATNGNGNGKPSQTTPAEPLPWEAAPLTNATFTAILTNAIKVTPKPDAPAKGNAGLYDAMKATNEQAATRGIDTKWEPEKSPTGLDALKRIYALLKACEMFDASIPA